MKTLWWKLRYAMEIRRLLKLPLAVCWEWAEIKLSFNRHRINETPKSVAKEDFGGTIYL